MRIRLLDHRRHRHVRRPSSPVTAGHPLAVRVTHHRLFGIHRTPETIPVDQPLLAPSEHIDTVPPLTDVGFTGRMDILASRIILRPADYPATLAFYRDGLGLAIAREYPGGTVFFAGQALIEVAGHGGGRRPSTFGGALWLQVRDLATATAELTARGVHIDRPARTEPWGLREMWISDPDGVPVVLVEVPNAHPLRRDIRPPEPRR